MTLQQFRFLLRVLTGSISSYEQIRDELFGQERSATIRTMQSCREEGWFLWEDNVFEVTEEGLQAMKSALPEYFT